MYLKQNGRCNNQNCKFSHTVNPEICNSFINNNCRLGNLCPKYHRLNKETSKTNDDNTRYTNWYMESSVAEENKEQVVSLDNDYPSTTTSSPNCSEENYPTITKQNEIVEIQIHQSENSTCINESSLNENNTTGVSTANHSRQREKID